MICIALSMRGWTVTAKNKAWQTVGNQRVLILARYRMGFSLQPLPDGCRLTVFVDYALPENGLGRLLGRLAGGAYARWCVRKILHQAAARFGRIPAMVADAR